MAKELAPEHGSTDAKPGIWKAWRPLWITLIVIFLAFGLSVWRVAVLIYTTQPHISGFFWSPEGTSYATAYIDGSIWITSTDATGKESSRVLVPRPLGRWDVPNTKYWTLSWSPDGKYIAGYTWKYFHVWDVATGRETRSPFNCNNMCKVVWNAESTSLTYLDFPFPSSLEKGDFIITTFPALNEGASVNVTVPGIGKQILGRSVEWMPDKSKVALYVQSKIYVIDATTGLILFTWDYTGRIAHLSWHPSGTRLASVKQTTAPGELAIIEIRDLTEDGKVVQSMVVPKSLVKNPQLPSFDSGWVDLKWSDDGKRIGYITCCFISNVLGAQRTARICLMTWWDVESGKLIAHQQRDIRDMEAPFLKSACLKLPFWSKDLEAVAVPVEHYSLLRLLGRGEGYPYSIYSGYGDYGTVLIDKAPGTVPRSSPATVAP